MSNSASKEYLPQEWLVMLRQRSGLTQVQLAALIGLRSERMIQNWEGGYSLPKADRLKKLIEVYLGRSNFIPGREKEEAKRLWLAIKNFFDANATNFELYPVFDEGWFDKVVKSPPEFNPTGISQGQARGTSDRPQTNLPTSLNTFIGRGQEIAELKELILRPQTRLVTILGFGGIGKTRLGLEVAGKLISSFPDGVFLVELDVLGDTRFLVEAIINALGLGKSSTDNTLNTLMAFLRSRRILLFLDNTEHLKCAPLIEKLLKQSPNLKIMVTSREELGIVGEITYRVGPLSLPLSLSEASPPESLSGYEAVQFFIEKATLADPAFRLTKNNATAVAEICQYLEGIPLALELASARLKILSLNELAARLQNALQILGSNSRYTMLRQQTLRASLDWSYALLSDRERTVLERLAVFSGGWSLAAAEYVCVDEGEGEGDAFSRSQILEILTNLLDKSFILAEESFKGGPKRLRLLEIILFVIAYNSQTLAGPGQPSFIPNLLENFKTLPLQLTRLVIFPIT